MDTADDPQEVVRRSFQAYVDSDREAIEALIAEDFRFFSPLDNGLDRETYFARCWLNSDWIAGFAFVRMATAGETVFVTYEATTTEGARFRNTEMFTVRGGRIVEVEVYFGWSLPHEAPPGGFVMP